MTTKQADRLYKEMQKMSAKQLASLWKLAYLMIGQKYLEELE